MLIYAVLLGDWCQHLKKELNYRMTEVEENNLTYYFRDKHNIFLVTIGPVNYQHLPTILSSLYKGEMDHFQRHL